MLHNETGVSLYGMPFIYYFCGHCVSLSMVMGDNDTNCTSGEMNGVI